MVPVYDMFVRAFPERSDLALASVGSIEEVIRPLGLRWRAPLLKKLLGERLATAGHKLPDTLEEPPELPSVGQYSAAAFLSLHRGKRAMIMDSNIVPWICRISECPLGADLCEYGREVLTGHRNVDSGKRG